MLCKGRKLVAVHKEASVSGDIYHRSVRVAQLAADGCSKTVTHCAKSAAGSKASFALEVVKLCSPHLVLSHLGGDDSLSLGELVKFLYNILRKNLVVAVHRDHFKGIFLLPLLYLLHPLGVALLLEHGSHLVDYVFKIPCNMVINVDILADLRRVYLDVYDLLAVCKGIWVAKHSV